MVSKIRILKAIETSTNCDGGIIPLSHKVESFTHFVDISFASKFLSTVKPAISMPISKTKKRG